ncbi:MAG TPA: low molecular weight phosphatase family protein [Candidatus Acidoferrales bacterium]|nr:low molecular weight phosphatase family protein [Candidatus Acidoferrales bacterium]
MDPAKRYRVLFVCLGNSCRSPIAEAIATHKAADVIVPVSGGTIPLGFVAPMTLRVLEERGMGVEGLASTPITRGMRENAEIIVNMTGSPASRFFQGEESKTEDWTITDPYGKQFDEYQKTYDEIDARMTEFAARLRARRAGKQVPAAPANGGD